MSLLKKLEPSASSQLTTMALVGTAIVLGAVAIRHSIEIKELKKRNDLQVKLNNQLVPVVLAQGGQIRNLHAKELL